MDVDAQKVLAQARDAILELMAANTDLLNSHLGKPLYRQSHDAVQAISQILAR